MLAHRRKAYLECRLLLGCQKRVRQGCPCRHALGAVVLHQLLNKVDGWTRPQVLDPHVAQAFTSEIASERTCLRPLPRA